MDGITIVSVLSVVSEFCLLPPDGLCEALPVDISVGFSVKDLARGAPPRTGLGRATLADRTNDHMRVLSPGHFF